jgi:Lrp/AsnC family transcriptional regulator for asnA, asnC and gidA
MQVTAAVRVRQLQERAKRRFGAFELAKCAAEWYESCAMRSEDVRPLRISASGSDRGPVAPARQTDELDRRIIEALQANGRESFRSIAARVGVSEATVRARYGRLTAQGILQVVAVTNPLGLGYEQALVGIKTSGSPEQAADAIARWPEADYVIATAGQFDLVVELVAADRRHLLELTSRLRALPDVVSTETFMYLELWKQLYDWGSGMPKEETTR